MTDEEFNNRMEALARRHEALTMNLELMSHQQEALHASIEEIVPLVKDLVRVAAMHEHRITRLEGGPKE